MKNHNIISILILALIISCTTKEEHTESSNNSVITFTDNSGNSISKEDLKKSTGKFNYKIYRTEGVTTLAKSLHQQARQIGQTGDYKLAIKKLEQAIKEAPNWPYPFYDLAYTYLLQDDFENALKYYQLTDKLAPKGFYTSKTALHTLKREAKGDLQKGLYKSYLSLEWINNLSEKKKMIEILVDKFPSFAPAWKDYSNLLKGKERLKAIEKGLGQNPDIETKGMLIINKALSINESGDYKKATLLLTELIFNRNSSLGNIEMAKFILNNISKNK